MADRWLPVFGEFDQRGERLVFQGRAIAVDNESEPRDMPSFGAALNSERFTGGEVSATIEFGTVDAQTACELILFRDPASGFMTTAGLGGSGFGMYTIRHYEDGQGKGWAYHRDLGDRRNLKPGKKYQVAATVQGSRVSLSVDGVEVTSANLPYSLPETHVGVWCLSRGEIFIHRFKVETRRARAFIIMQFTSPYNELYIDVIRAICREFQLDVIRADEEYGPGIIVADVANQIVESKVLIAEITPANPNVYYEIGYGHALNKPTILIAEKGTKLPFDVAPHRVLFYENSINGKSKLEEGLRHHLRAILRDATQVT